ncbi:MULTISPECIES: Gfo/Idh/MocA family oxidoreductase [unclassified Pseudarthrobacter]|uniref:Gfo/Idh/MocA family oxidoreductase n=1 Tax=unclassified Pseudarthrobacter TaxID=2647000 RepID=UPI003643D347
MSDLRIGVVGYGTGGRNFHTPFIEAAQGITLAGVVTRSTERTAEVAADWPGVPVFGSLADMVAAGVDAVTITTPPGTHPELAFQAIAAGLHVMVDKPFAPSAAEGRELAAAADRAGVVLSAYHNRRWDADARTLAGVLSEGRLGELWRVYSRMDQHNPGSLTAGAADGLLLDLGSHLVDQLIWLLGPVQSVNAHVDWVETDSGCTDAGFTLDLVHTSGARSYAEASKANHAEARELRAYGSKGSYLSLASDVQAAAVLSGLRPAAMPEEWGYEDHDHWPILSTASGRHRIPSLQGRWHDLYGAFAKATRDGGPAPVPAREAIRTLQVLDAARESALAGSTVEVGVP